MLKSTYSFLIISFISLVSLSAQPSLDELRVEYLKALHDYEEAPGVYEQFLKIKNPSAKTLAYQGALEAIMTKTTWNLFKKVAYLNKSEASFNAAIAKNPKDVEIRFMRMAVQYEIPEYLGFSDDMETDEQFLINHIDEFDPVNFDHDTLSEILRFMKKCNRFSDAQIERFKRILALK